MTLIALGDPGRELAQEVGGLAGGELERRAEVPVGAVGPRSHLVPGRLPRRDVGETAPVRDGGVEPRGERAEVGGDLRGELEADLTRRE